MSGDITGALPYTITVGGKFTVGRKEREKDNVNIFLTQTKTVPEQQ